MTAAVPLEHDREWYPHLTPCPACGAALPTGDSFTTWCHDCDWNVNGGNPVEPRQHTLLSGWRRRITDWAATRVYAGLAQRPEAVTAGRAHRLAVTLAVAVLVGVGLLLAAAIAFALSLQGVPRVVALALLALTVWFFLPGRGRPDPRCLTVDPVQAPELHEAVARLADTLGAQPPDAIRVDTSYNLAVLTHGAFSRPVLVVGLPLWTAMAPEQRLAVISHELGHLKRRDLRTRRLIGLAQDLMWGTADLLWPRRTSEDGGTGAELLVLATGALQRVAALPFIGVALVLDRADASARQEAEYLADRLAARLAGTSAAVSALASVLGPEPGQVAASAALRRGEDPWQPLREVRGRPQREIRRLARVGELVGHRSDDSHPPTHLRIRLLEECGPVTGRAPGIDAATWAAIDRELEPFRRELTPQFVDDLLEA